MSHECTIHHNACDCREAERQFQIEQLDRQIAELTEKLAAAEAQNNFDAARLRRLVTFCGTACPDSDEELLQVAGVVIGACLRVLPSMLAKERQAGRDEMQKELSEQEPFTYMRFNNGDPDWAEDCIGSADAVLDSYTAYSDDDIYTAVALIIRPQPPKGK